MADFDNQNMLSVFVTALQQVLPALVARLPLKTDMEENKTVYRCLTMLYNKSPQLVLHTVNHPSFFANL